MNKQKLLGKIACWCGYCLFAGYSAYMTAKSIAMSFEMNDSVLVVFIFVFIVALLAGWCLTLVIGELQNRFNPNRMRFLGGLFGFLLFWGVSFATNVHYMFMNRDGLQVVNAELGSYKSFVEDKLRNNREGVQEKEDTDVALCAASVSNLLDQFNQECDASIRPGFGARAVSILKEIENYFSRTAAQYNDLNVYEGSIFNDEKDRGDIGRTGVKEVTALKQKYNILVLDRMDRRVLAIRNYYKKQKSQVKNLDVIQHFINDSLYVVDIPQITEIASPDVYYKFQKVQLTGNIFNRFDSNDQMEILSSMKMSKTSNPEDIKKGKFRYRIYPSSRMFGTFNVWDDLLHKRLPEDMKLFGWILFSLIIDIVAFILRVLCK